MAVVGAGEVSSVIRMAAAGLPDLGQTVGEVAEGGTPGHSDETERCNRDACADNEAVEQQDQRGYGGERNDDEHDSKRHECSVDHVIASIAKASAPRPKPRKSRRDAHPVLIIRESVRLLLTFRDLRPLIEERPAGHPARRVVPDYAGDTPPVFPPSWLEPLRTAAAG